MWSLETNARHGTGDYKRRTMRGGRGKSVSGEGGNSGGRALNRQISQTDELNNARAWWPRSCVVNKFEAPLSFLLSQPGSNAELTLRALAPPRSADEQIISRSVRLTRSLWGQVAKHRTLYYNRCYLCTCKVFHRLAHNVYA